jgi:hypothetical protein
MTTLIPPDYAAWLAELKTTIRTARLKVGLAVNRELVLLYWRIGKEILERQSAQGWGAKVIDQPLPDGRDFRPGPLARSASGNAQERPCLFRTFAVH